MMKNKMIYLSSIVALVIAVIIALNTGSISLNAQDLQSLFSQQWSDNLQSVIDLRLPRIILSLFVGAALAVSGLLLQIIFRNPLVDPSIIGINAGALVVKLIILFVIPQLLLISTLLSFLGGLAVFLLIYKIVDKGHFHPLKILMTGVAMNALLNALLDIFKLNPLNNVPQNLSQKTWSDVVIVVIIVTVLLLILWIMRKIVDVLHLSDEMMIGLGVSVKKVRISLSLIAIILASLITAVVGNIAFIGLLVPAVAKRLVGYRFIQVLPLSILLGGLLLIVADTIGRMVLAPIEISASIILAFIGAPFLIVLIKKEIKY